MLHLLQIQSFVKSVFVTYDLTEELFCDFSTGDWEFQSSPTQKHQLGKPIKAIEGTEHLPNFGPARDKRSIAWSAKCVVSAGEVSLTPTQMSLERKPANHVPTIADIIGRSLDKVGTYGQLNNQEQVQFDGNISPLQHK